MVVDGFLARHDREAHRGRAAHEAPVGRLRRGVVGRGRAAAGRSSEMLRTPLAARLVANEASLEASEVMHALGRIGERDDLAA